jgi:hypothetical protein
VWSSASREKRIESVRSTSVRFSRIGWFLLSPWLPASVMAAAVVAAFAEVDGDARTRESAIRVWGTMCATGAGIWMLQSILARRFGRACVSAMAGGMIVEATWGVDIGFFNAFCGAGAVLATGIGVGLSIASMRATAAPRMVGILIGLLPLAAALLGFRANDLYCATAREFCDTVVLRVESWRDRNGKYPKKLDLVGISDLYVPRRYRGFYSDGEGYSISYYSDVWGNSAQCRRSDIREWHREHIGL